MADKKRTRDQAHAARRRAHYLQKLRDARTDTHRVGVAADFVRALLVKAPPQIRARVGQEVVTLLLSAVDVLDPAEKRGGRR